MNTHFAMNIPSYESLLELYGENNTFFELIVGDFNATIEP